MPPRDAEDELRRKERVIAAVDLPGVPEGTEGRVTTVEGLTWIRYWVRFANGVQIGSIHRRKLARPREWAEILRRREAGEDIVEEAAAGASAGAETAPAAAGEGVLVNGVNVPAHLLERSKSRRAVLAG